MADRKNLQQPSRECRPRACLAPSPRSSTPSRVRGGAVLVLLLAAATARAEELVAADGPREPAAAPAPAAPPVSADVPPRPEVELVEVLGPTLGGQMDEGLFTAVQDRLRRLGLGTAPRAAFSPCGERDGACLRRIATGTGARWVLWMNVLPPDGPPDEQPTRIRAGLYDSSVDADSALSPVYEEQCLGCGAGSAHLRAACASLAGRLVQSDRPERAYVPPPASPAPCPACPPHPGTSGGTESGGRVTTRRILLRSILGTTFVASLATGIAVFATGAAGPGLSTCGEVNPKNPGSDDRCGSGIAFGAIPIATGLLSGIGLLVDLLRWP